MLTALLLGGCARATPVMVVPPRPESRVDAPPTFVVQRPGALVEVHVGDGFALGSADFERWTARSVDGIRDYFGRFAAPNVYFDVRPTAGHGVGFGTAYGGRAPWIFVEVGTGADVRDLDRDWVLVHELIHLAFPHLADEHRWAMEGMATFVEPFIRLRDGTLSREALWQSFVERMPYGLPGDGDRGLDHTPTWGRTYWGGALFWLVAEVELRRRSDNARGVRGAFRAIIAAGGDKRWLWTMEKTLETGDAATGHDVLIDQWRVWRTTPIEVDLDALWRELGITRAGRDIVLAPSPMREAIEAQRY